MPPKRKRVEDTAVEVAPRATRTSSRLKNSATSSSDATAKKAGGDKAVVAAEPAAKKAKKAPTKATSGKGAKAKADTATSPNESTSTANPSGGTPAASTKSAPSKGPSKPEPYSEDRAKQLFKTYEDPDTPGQIGPEGFEKLCTDLDISFEGALPLVLAWQLHATEMAKFQESEWMQGVRELRASNLSSLSLVLHDLEQLLLLDKPPTQSSGSSIASKKKGLATSDPSEPYSRANYNRYAADTKKAFNELYAFCFALAKPPTARNIDMDTAAAFWSVLVAPKYPIMKDILEFINEKGTYKGVNKDLWNMVLEFARSVKPDLSDFEADGAWPSMLDDFVSWKKSQVKEAANSQDTED